MLLLLFLQNNLMIWHKQLETILIVLFSDLQCEFSESL